MLQSSVFCSSIFVLSCAILPGCSKDYPPFIYETTSMSLNNADNSGETPVLDLDSVPGQAYAIQLDLTMVMKDKTGADINESSYVNEDEVTAFSITSPDPFNNVPPNQSLNQFFNYSSGSGTGAIISDASYTSIFSAANRMQNGNADQWMTQKYLLLMYPPDNPGNYTFIVSATFSDTKVLTDTISVKLY